MNSISPDMLRGLVRAVSATKDDTVNISKPVIRAILFETIRLMEAESIMDNKRAAYVQSLTMEYACLHLGDQVDALLHQDLREFSVQDLINFVKAQLAGMAADAAIKLEGKS